MTFAQAKKHYGSVNNMAAALKISHQAIYAWKGVIPIGSQFQIEIETKGKLKADRTARAKK